MRLELNLLSEKKYWKILYVVKNSNSLHTSNIVIEVSFELTIDTVVKEENRKKIRSKYPMIN